MDKKNKMTYSIAWAVLSALVIWVAPVGAATEQAGDDWIARAYHRSLANEGLQKYDAAIRALEPVREAYPDGYTVNLRLGWLNYLAGHHANAIGHYRKAIATVPSNIEARLGLLLPLLAQKRYAEAEQVAGQVLRSDFYNYYGNLRLILALRGQEKHDAARKVAQRMLALYPADVSFLQQLALSEQALGRKEEALRLFRSVYVLDPDNPVARSHLGMTGDKQ